MGISFRNTALSAGVACGVLMGAVSDAAAGGFAVREQSTYGQGASFAGIAAGGALSGMFWNPAVMTQFPGLNAEAGLAGILPNAEQNPGLGTSPALLALGGVGNSGDDALVPSTYASWQVTPSVWLGLSVNAPFGLSVSFPDAWAGRNYAMDTSLKTYNAAPSIAVRVNEWLSFGVGVQIMYATADLTSGFSPLGPGIYIPGARGVLDGNGWAFGATAGITITPGPNTIIGLGWRSALDLDIDDGTLTVIPVLVPSIEGPASTTVRLPDIVTLSGRHKVSPQFTLLGTIEWSNWSRIGTTTVTVTGAPGLTTTLPFEYDDGWFFSVGGEYAYSETLTFRAGVGYEISPITDSVRTPRLPDNDRVWTSIGLSYRAMDNLWLDLAYTHIFVKDTPINIVPGNPWFELARGTYVGTADSSVDIISLGLRYRFGAPPQPPLVVKG